MIGCLSSINASRSVQILQEELNLKDTFIDALIQKYEGLLEKKWTTNALLQRKVRTSANVKNADTNIPTQSIESVGGFVSWYCDVGDTSVQGKGVPCVVAMGSSDSNVRMF